MTHIKRPKVTKVNGKVRNSSTGLTNVLRIPRIAAATMAPPRPCILTPETKVGTIRTYSFALFESEHVDS